MQETDVELDPLGSATEQGDLSIEEVERQVEAEQAPARSEASLSLSDPLGCLARMQIVRGQAYQTLREQSLGDGWFDQVQNILQSAQSIIQRNPDTFLYYLINEKIHHERRYSSLHALTCSVIAMLVARQMDWSEDEVQYIGVAALCMNIAMSSLQDFLAAKDTHVSEHYNKIIQSHSRKAVEVLETFGPEESLVREIVAMHHTPYDGNDILSEPPEVRLPELLRLIDMYCAKMSRRKRREAMTAMDAAKGVLVGDDGLTPNTLGAFVLKTVGLYPPGTYVELQSGERAVVMQRGPKMHTPLVLVMRRADGAFQQPFIVRMTGEADFAIRRSIKRPEMGVEVSPERAWDAISSAKRRGRL